MRARDRRAATRLETGDVVVPVIAGVTGVLASYAAAGATQRFAAAPVELAVARGMPGPAVSAAILLLGDLAQSLSLAVAVTAVAAAYAVIAWLATRITRDVTRPDVVGPVLAGVLTWIGTLVVTGAPIPSLGPGAAVLITLATAASLDDPTAGPVDRTRRRAIAALAALLGVGAVGALARTQPTAETSLSLRPDDAAAVGDRLALAADRSLDVPGLEPLVSTSFYEVDTAAVNPTVDADTWTLSVTGAVDEPVRIDYDDLTARPAEHEFATLRCVGDDLNGRKMDTALWTGIPLLDLVSEARPRSGCECVMLRSTDGYYEEIPISALRPALVAYAMNGDALPRRHGYPARAVVPGHWGEIHVKWLSEIEVLEREEAGYWEQRGWQGTGPVKPVAKLHLQGSISPTHDRVGGHAYAGRSGVAAVEVSIDGGDTWREATLSDPLPGAATWRQWVYEYEPPDGGYGVVVRAVTADGETQTRERSGPMPSGPTGWVSVNRFG